MDESETTDIDIGDQVTFDDDSDHTELLFDKFNTGLIKFDIENVKNDDDDDNNANYNNNDDNNNSDFINNQTVVIVNHVYSYNGWKNYRRIAIASLFILIIAIILILILIIFKKQHSHSSKSDDDILHCSLSNYENSKVTIHRIILFGDSLIAVPTESYDLDVSLYNRISNQYPYLHFDMISSGIGGNRILDLKRRVGNDVIDKQPEAVIMYWDSDVSDPSIDYLSSQDGIEQYTNNLIDVITAFKNSVKYVAISGPNLLGELPEGENSRDKYLNMYRQINRDVALSYNVTYIDIRQAFLDADRLKGWDKSVGFLTTDGEHPSEAGSKIEEDLFYNQLELWYKNICI